MQIRVIGTPDEVALLREVLNLSALVRLDDESHPYPSRGDAGAVRVYLSLTPLSRLTDPEATR